MRKRKSRFGSFDQEQSEAFDRVVAALKEGGGYEEATYDAFRSKLARIIVDLASGAERDADQLARAALETLIVSKRVQRYAPGTSVSSADADRPHPVARFLIKFRQHRPANDDNPHVGN